MLWEAIDKMLPPTYSPFSEDNFLLLDVQRYFSDVTVLLSLTVFLNQVSDSMPNTSDAVPLISIRPSHQLAYSS